MHSIVIQKRHCTLNSFNQHHHHCLTLYFLALTNITKMSSEDEKKIDNIPGKEKGEIQTIHEMITEALMGTGHSNTPLDSVYTDTNIKSVQLSNEQGNLIHMNDRSGPLTLGKLYSQFKDLDLRLAQVEEVIYKREDFVGKKRAPTLSRSQYSADPCFPVDQGGSPSRLSDFTTINPILTSSADILSITSFPDSDSFAYSLNTTQYNKSSKIQKKDDIKVFTVICLYINLFLEIRIRSLLLAIVGNES